MTTDKMEKEQVDFLEKMEDARKIAKELILSKKIPVPAAVLDKLQKEANRHARQLH